ncbi:MAG: selenium-dependent xanthine dehydrogenase [Acidobacteriota bacterium]
MKFLLNGQERTYDGDPDQSLLDYLRQGGILSVKDGCSPQAACGCCTVQLNQKAVLACVTGMKKVAGGELLTLEGLSPYQRDTFANAFLAKGGVQCGFCIPGMVMQSKALLDQNSTPEREEIVRALGPNLCRCTGYKKIIDSVCYAAAAMREGKSIPRPKCSGKVGTSQPKYDSYDVVLGEHPYVADMTFEGMQHGALRFSDHPRAEIVSIDTAEARKLPGVTAVFTARDIPGDRQIGLIRQDWPLMAAEGETTRYVGDVLAGVVAETEKVARRAARLIQVRYRVLEPVTDPHAAMAAESPAIHEGGNLLSRTVIRRGDAARELAEAAWVSHGIYQTQTVEHGFLELEAAIAMPWQEDPCGPGGVKIYSQGQGVYEDREQIARLLGLSPPRVNVIQVPNGGGFGGKEDLSVQGHAALFAHLLQAPVKIVLTREESISMHPKRHPLWMDYTVGCDEKGKLTVVKANIVGDTGAYASVGMKVLERAAGHATGAYQVPVVDIVSRAVYTNNIPNGAMRGFGVNQVTFAMESCIDDLCERGGFDRWRFRYDNAIAEGAMTATGQVVASGAGLRQTLLAVKDIFRKARCAGIACGIKNTGIGNGMPDSSQVKIVIESAHKVVIHHGWTEMGQGVHTMAVQTLCQETGLEPDRVEVVVDTAAEAYSGMTTASRATSLVGNAIIEACKSLKSDLATHSLAELRGKVYRGEWTVDWTTKPGKEKAGRVLTHYSYSYATQVVELDNDGQLSKVTAAHDAGRIFNPLLFEGQIEGSLHMGLGYALSEELVQEGGRPASTLLRKMGILRSREVPEIEVIGVEVPDPYGPYGAKGVGEIGLVPTAAAVANALYQFDGVRRYKLPMKMKKKWRKPAKSSSSKPVARPIPTPAGSR